MAFGRPFAWHIGFIVFILAACVAVGVRVLRSKDEPEAGIEDRVEADIGEVTLSSGAVIIGDGPSLRGPVRLDDLPGKVWSVGVQFAGRGRQQLLDEVVLRAAVGAASAPVVDHEVVVDSGEIVVVDAAASSRPFQSDSIEEEMMRSETGNQRARGAVRFLREADGTVCGLTLRPPFGDGVYPVRVARRGGVLEIRIRVRVE